MANKVVAVTLTARTAAYVAQMGAAAKATAGVGAAARGAAVAAQPMGRSLRNAARATGILNPKLIGGAGLVFGLKSVVGQAKNFEDQFAMVRKTMQESDEVLDQVALNIRELATGLPITTRELNEIATVAGQLGIAASDVSDFTETMAHLSIATNLTAEGAAIDFARLSNIMGKPIDEVRELGNVVVHLGNNMAAQETEIMEFAKRISGVGTQMGMTEQDILALAAALPALGLRAEMGGTAITRIMVEINKAVTEGSEKLDIMAATAGMSAQEFAAAWRSDPADTLMEFTAGIGRMSDEGADAFATIADLDLSMIRTQDTALRLAGGTAVYAEAQRLANFESERQEAVQIELDKRLNTTASQWAIFKNNVREAAIEMGGPLNTALKETLKLLNEGVREDGFLKTLFLPNFQRPGEEQSIFSDLTDLFGWRRDEGFGTWFTGDVFGQTTANNHEDLDSHMAAMRAQATQYVTGLLEMAAASDHAASKNLALQQAIEGVTDPLLRAEAASWDTSTATLSLVESLQAAAESSVIAAEGLENYIDWKTRAVDPVYNLMSALDDVEEAHAAYNDTLDENGDVTAESADAAVEYHRRLEALEAAAISGDLSFSDFDRRLQHWVKTGKMTSTEADLIRQRVQGAREESERYDGQYVANLIAHTETAEERIRRVRNLIASIPARIHTSLFLDASSYNAAVARVARTGRMEAVHTGGYVHPSGKIQKFHSGGMVGGLRQDEVPAILQTGEMVLSRYQVGQIGAAFAAGTKPKSSGSMSIVVELDGRVIGRAVAPHISGETRIRAGIRR